MSQRSLLTSSSGFSSRRVFAQHALTIYCCINVMFMLVKQLRWSRGSVLVFGTQVHRFKPGQSHWIFQGEKILSASSFRREVKPFVSCRIFAACKRNQKCMRGSRSFQSKLLAISHPSSSPFTARVSGGDTWRFK